MLIATYEYSALGTGEKSINRENSGSAYFYMNIMDQYTNIYYNNASWDSSNPKNLTYFENDMKEFALLHGYSLDFVCNDNSSNVSTKVIFVDRGVRIEEDLTGELGPCP
jgi:hypothetical protein